MYSKGKKNARTVLSFLYSHLIFRTKLQSRLTLEIQKPSAAALKKIRVRCLYILRFLGFRTLKVKTEPYY